MKVCTDIAMTPMATDTRGNDPTDGSAFAALLAGFAAPATTPPSTPAPTGETSVASAGAVAVTTGAAFDLAIASVASPALTGSPGTATPTDLPAAATAPSGAATATEADRPAAAPTTDAGEITVIDLTVTFADDAATDPDATRFPAGPAAPAEAPIDGAVRTTPPATASLDDAAAPTAPPSVGPTTTSVGTDDETVPGSATQPDAPPVVTSTRSGLPAVPAGAGPAVAEPDVASQPVTATTPPTYSGATALAAPIDGARSDAGPADGTSAVLATRATAEQHEVTAPKLVVPPNRVDTVAVAAARASAEASRPIRLSVRLDPPNLGEVRVELTARGNQVTMRLEPTVEISGPALHQQRNAVAAALERTGFQLAGFDIANPEQQKRSFVPEHNSRRDVATDADEPIEPTAAADGLRI